MAIVFADRVKETTASTGTLNLTLAGAVTGFRTFNSAVGVGPYFYYAITSSTGAEWETGIGYLSNSTTFARVGSPFASSNNGSRVSFSAGTKNVFLTLPAKAENTVVLGNAGGTPEAYISYTALGANTQINGSVATAVGASAIAAENSTAVGGDAVASGATSVAIGKIATASGSGSVAVGRNTISSGDYTTAVGYGAVVNNFYGTAVGQFSTASGNNAVALGGGNTASGVQALAAGVSSSAQGNFSVALGSNLTTDSEEQFSVRVRTDPSGVDTTYSLKYDNGRKEIYASSAGTAGGVTQIVAGTNVTITSTGPTPGTGVVTINATSGPGPSVGFDWFTLVKTPLSPTIAAPSNFVANPTTSAILILAGSGSNPLDTNPQGAPWNSGSSNGIGPTRFLTNGNWQFLTPPYVYASGASNGIFFNYTMYPGSHTSNGFQDVWGVIPNWNNGYGTGISISNSVGQSNRQIRGVIVIQSGGSDLTTQVAANPSLPATTLEMSYDGYAGLTVVAFENLSDGQVGAILSGLTIMTWGGTPYSYCGHIWVEYT